MTTGLVILLCVFSAVVGWAWDQYAWRRLSLPELLKRADPRSLSTARRALQELVRRGQPIQHLLAAHAAQLVDESAFRRVASLQVIRAFFPGEATLLKGYSASADVAACRQAVGPLLASLPGRPGALGGDVSVSAEASYGPGLLGGASLLLLFASLFVYWKGPAILDKTWHVMLAVVSLNALGLITGAGRLLETSGSKGGAKGTITPWIVAVHALLLLVIVGVPLWRLWGE